MEVIIVRGVLNIFLEFIIVYVLIFILNYLFFVRKKTKYNKDKVPIEFFYLVSLYKLDQTKINYKQFIYVTAFINTFIVAFTYIVIYRLLDKWIWQLLFGIVIIILLIIICYGLLGKYYQKRIKKVGKRGK